MVRDLREFYPNLFHVYDPLLLNSLLVYYATDEPTRGLVAPFCFVCLYVAFVLSIGCLRGTTIRYSFLVVCVFIFIS